MTHTPGMVMRHLLLLRVIVNRTTETYSLSLVGLLKQTVALKHKEEGTILRDVSKLHMLMRNHYYMCSFCTESHTYTVSDYPANGYPFAVEPGFPLFIFPGVCFRAEVKVLSSV